MAPAPTWSQSWSDLIPVVYADKKRRPTPEFQPGDWVLVNIKQFRLQTGLCRKLAPRYIGPFRVVSAIEPHRRAYRLKLPDNLSRVYPVFHVNALREYKVSGTYQPPPTPQIVDGHVEYEVDCILNTRGEGKKREYLVLWEGYEETTWEPKMNLTYCPLKLAEFWSKKDIPCPHVIPGLERALAEQQEQRGE
jgi:hypothetical protein